MNEVGIVRCAIGGVWEEDMVKDGVEEERDGTITVKLGNVCLS